MNTYEDMLVTDIERIRRAKAVLKTETDRRSKTEAINLINLYKSIAKEYEEKGTNDERDRAREIIREIQR